MDILTHSGYNRVVDMFNYSKEQNSLFEKHLNAVFEKKYLRNKVIKYFFVFLITFSVIVVKHILPDTLGREAPYLMVLFAVFLSAYIAGLKAGLLSTIATVISVNYLFSGPIHQFSIKPVYLLQNLTYILQGFCISYLVYYASKKHINEYRQRQWFETTLSSIGDAVIATDCYGKIVFMNKVAEDLTGWKAKKACGLDSTQVFKIINEKTRNKAISPVEKVIKENKIINLTNNALLINKKGEEIAIDDSAAPIRDISGKMTGVVLVFRDITYRKLLENKKDEFITIASHELKTPLTTIKGYVQILERNISNLEPDKAKLFIAKTNLYINRLHNLIEDFLDVSKIQAGKLRMQMDKFDIHDLILESVESTQIMANSHRIIIQNDLHQEIAGDKMRLEQVLTNLLSNAIKYSPGKGEVYVKATKVDSSVEISVEDRGIGIPKESINKIFNRFYRIENVAHKYSGLGLGLYISQEIVKRHKGSIWVESVVGRGSVFRLALPIKISSFL